MHLLPYLAAYLGIAVFLVAVVARVVMWAAMPMHVRWELYPVAHEGPRARYGGSYMEEGEWWTKPRHVSRANELRAMLAEIVFMVAVREHNPRLWRRTFPFHFGLYLVITCTVLMLANSTLAAASDAASSAALGDVLRTAVIVFGYAGAVLIVVGALSLLHRRLTDPNLRSYSSGADYFNLLFFVVAFGWALVTAAAVDSDLSRVTAFVTDLVTVRAEALAGEGWEVLLPTGSVLLLSVLLAYIPLTHMSHFIGKYFAYHAIRWNDTPNLRGGPQEKKIQAMLNQPVSWAAPHIQGDGKKTWADVATEKQKQ
jgi:nitrate reductase gamma subunit